MSIKKTIRLLTVVLLGGLYSVQAVAQTPAPSAPTAPPKPVAAGRSNPVVVENGAVAPQVVTILHRLNGLKVFRLLLRSNEEVGAVAKLDQAFKITGDVHTNVIAGLALDDGRTIAAWLPEAEAEIPVPPMLFAPKIILPPKPPGAASSSKEVPVPEGPLSVEVRTTVRALPGTAFSGNLLEPADLKIITREGKKLLGRYIGLDGLTGLSIIVLPESGLPKTVDAKEEIISVGQRLRLIGPEPASHPEPGAKNAMYVRLGETEAWIVTVNRSPSGGVARLKIKSPKLTRANIGGIAINDSGETLGIVDAVEGGEATIVPVALVRSAAKRVIARQASVPRPWLGVRGEPIGALTVERILRGGWQLERARALVEKRQGILLTSIAPGSPAALAQLKPGDVILSVNNGDVRNADDFSWLLDEAGLGSSVNFTVARPEKLLAEALAIKLSESPDPFFGLRRLEAFAPRVLKPGSLMAQGIEAIAIKPRVASRFGASGGLLVVWVQPATPASRAGLKPGDLIEAINGQQISSTSAPIALSTTPGAKSTFVIVRNKQKLVLTIQTTEKQ
ncbi:MAG TPA: hypothetical protein DCK99_16430 [Blastocatellia bacterium]|nr:hypothetical protein [Blastocatellia bacterium]